MQSGASARLVISFDMFVVTAPLRAPAFLQIFVASFCRRCAGVGGRGKGGVNSAVTNASDAAAFLEQGFVCVCSPMVEPSVYDELQRTIDLVTAPKELGVSSVDSTASVAGSAWDAEPAKTAVLALQHGAQDQAHVLVLGCICELQPCLRNAAAGLRAQTSG